MPQQLPLLAEERATYTTQRDDTGRAAAIERLRAKLADPIFRAIEGVLSGYSRDPWQLEPYIGSRGQVSEILSRKRPLTLPMIRRLEQATGIPGSVLIQPYETDQDDYSTTRKCSPMSHVAVR